MSKQSVTWIVALCALVVASLSPALADKRVALVIGNSQYKTTSLALPNAGNDAEDVASALRSLGFEVIHKNNASKRDLDTVVAQFARQAAAADAALFFYAGQARLHQGRSYLVPVEMDARDEKNLPRQAKELDEVRAVLDRAAGIKIMILDACRNNPVLDAVRRAASGAAPGGESLRGLDRIDVQPPQADRVDVKPPGTDRVDKPLGLVVACSSGPDDAASSGGGRNSSYAGALLRRLHDPALDIEAMFQRIAADISAQTNGRQRPEAYVSLGAKYYLSQADVLAWNQVKDSTDLSVLRNFIERFPGSPRMADAQARLQTLLTAARERQTQQDLTAQRRQEEERARLAAAERERQEREAAQRRQEEERARLAAAERERQERETAQRRQEEERARLAAAERERQERETAQRRQEEERVRLAAAERERRRQDEERARMAAVERERAEAARKQQEAQEKAEAERKRLAALPPALSEDACKRDAEQLARLRASQARDEIVRFERALGCERLRPQVQRLLESVGGPSEPRRVVEPQPEPPRQPTAAANPPPQLQSAPPPQPPATPEAATNTPPATASQADACKRDEEQLARLRASQARDEIVRFQRELGCERLRPQVQRLLESVGGQSELVRSATANPLPPARRFELETSTAAASQADACKRDEEQLARLRASPAPDAIVRFQRELGCQRLRPQVQRLLESVGGQSESLRSATANPQPPARRSELETSTAAASHADACKRDEERLARLRASPARVEVLRFERELACEKLRPQLVRLRESLGGD